jgi:hypothetical protein
MARPVAREHDPAGEQEALDSEAMHALLLVTLLAQSSPTGYRDTPKIPGQRWLVHDDDRPRPPVVTPGTFSAGATPPSDATVLFGGKDLAKWRAKDGGPAAWKVENGYFEVVPRTGDIFTREEFGDCQLHLEFAAPAVVKGNSQGRGNSGVFFFGLYEIQVLDSFDNKTYADGQAAAVYGQAPPQVNAARPPGEWQTYDIVFTAPRFQGDKLLSPASVTVFHNGVLTQNATRFLGPTKHRTEPKYEPHGERGPLKLQDHGDLVRYRNIWIRPLRLVE